MRLPAIINKIFDTPLLSVQGSWMDAAVFVAVFLLLGLSFVLSRRDGAAPGNAAGKFLVRAVSFIVFVFLFFICICILRNPVAGVSQIGWDDVSAFSNFFLFSMVAGFVLVAGNLYCGWICPLGSLQRVTARFSRFLTRRVKLAALFLVFVLQAYAMYVTRPAADFFTENIIAFWALFLLVVMALSLLVPRFRDYLAGIRYASMFLYVLITGLGVWFSEAWCWLTGSDIDYSSLIAFTVIFLASAVIPMAWCSLLCPTGTFLSLLGKQSFLKHKGPDADSEKN